MLADEFDFVCGTSTGAVIATCASTGMSTAQIRDFYAGGGRQMFDKASLFRRLRESDNDIQRAGREYAAKFVRREHLGPFA